MLFKMQIHHNWNGCLRSDSMPKNWHSSNCPSMKNLNGFNKTAHCLQ